MKVKAIAVAAGNVIVTIQSHTGHNYELQKKPRLTDTARQKHWPPANRRSRHRFTFTNSGGTGAFNRVSVTP